MGKGFKFQVNGIDFYAKGANYIPLDFFHTRVDSVIYEKALKNVEQNDYDAPKSVRRYF